MMPMTVGSQVEAERILAEIRIANEICGDNKDSDEYALWEKSTDEDVLFFHYVIPPQCRNAPAVKSASRLFDNIPDGKLVRPNKPEPQVLRCELQQETHGGEAQRDDCTLQDAVSECSLREGVHRDGCPHQGRPHYPYEE